MTRPSKSKKERLGSIDLEKRWKNACDSCKNPLDEDGALTTSTSIRQIFLVPRLIFLPESKIPLIIEELKIHLLVCDECIKARGNPVAIEDRGFYREQKILWDKTEQTAPDNCVTKFCGLCTKAIACAREDELEDIVGAIYSLPRLIIKRGGLKILETKKSEIRLVICKTCVATQYNPGAVEQTWKFEGDILSPELVSIKKRN